MTAHVSPDAPRPPSGIRDSGGPMPFNEADFTRTAAELVAEGDRVPTQRENGRMTDVEPFNEWSIDTAIGDERWQLTGHIYSDRIPPAEVLRYVEAIAAGLRAAGFEAEVQLVRELREVRRA